MVRIFRTEDVTKDDLRERRENVG